MTAFRATRTLPEEVMTMIASRHHDIIFRSKLKKWEVINWFLAGHCIRTFHSAIDEVRNAEIPCDCDSCISEEGCNCCACMRYEARANEEADWHQEELKDYCDELGYRDSNSKFAKCAQVCIEFPFDVHFSLLIFIWQTFLDDLGIHPHFMIQKRFNDPDFPNSRYISSVKVDAFLLLPVQSMPMTYEPGPALAPFITSNVLDLSAIKELTEDQSRQFKVVIDMLNLRPNEEKKAEAKHEAMAVTKHAAGVDQDDEGRSEKKSGTHEKENWPKLMILGCGELDAKDCEVCSQ